MIADESHLKDPNDQFLLYWLLGMHNNKSKYQLEKEKKIIKEKLIALMCKILNYYCMRVACDFDMTEARKRLLKVSIYKHIMISLVWKNITTNNHTFITQCLEWRHENRIDFIQQEFQYPDVILKYMPMRVIGHDKLRNPGNYKCELI